MNDHIIAYLRNSASKVKLMGFPLAGVFGVMVYASITRGVKDESEREYML